MFIFIFSKPMIPIAHWNVSSQLTEDLPRTTNSVEAWHNALGKSLTANHPVIWRVIEVIKEEFALSIAHIAASQFSQNKSRNLYYQTLTEEIQKKLEELRNEEIGAMDFVRFISLKVKFVC